MPAFDKHNDKIAISLKRFKLLKKPGMFGKYFEPYIVTFAVDSNGPANPEIELSTIPFAKFRVGQEKHFLNHGRFIYQPNNPGEYVAYSLLFMESEKDTREVAGAVRNILQEDETRTILKTLILAKPDLGGALTVVQRATVLVASILEKQKDRELYFTDGALLRDVNGPPYDIDTSTVDGNDFIECEISVIPLPQSDFESISVGGDDWNYTERISLS
ncbi:MAG: hypothetical protein P1V20_02990 [Verrucomicrobiales bacterium]|nr:hypothetical protein [Verrucomicrobiales bacterium]